VQLCNKKKKKNCFEVATPNRTYFLVAETEEEMNKCMESVKQSINGGKGTSGNGTGQTKRIGVQDFDLLNVIGKGSFGKVRIVFALPGSPFLGITGSQEG
jgi:hypothetical protein